MQFFHMAYEAINSIIIPVLKCGNSDTKGFSNLPKAQQKAIKLKLKHRWSTPESIQHDCCTMHLSHQCGTGGTLFRKGNPRPPSSPSAS